MTDIFNVSLKDFLITVRKSWLIILIFSLVGLFGAYVYLLVTPNLYLATGQIQLSQTRAANYDWVNIEDPNLSIARVKSPTNITDKMLLACQYSSAVDLSKQIQMSLIKTSPPILNVSIKNLSPESSSACMSALIDEIKASQFSLITEKSIQHQKLIQQYLSDLNKLKREYSQLSFSQGGITAVDEIVLKERIKLTSEKIFTLDNFIRSAVEGSSKLLAPIYVSSSPVSPKRLLTLIAGLLSGIFIGLLISILRHLYLPRISALS